LIKPNAAEKTKAFKNQPVSALLITAPKLLTINKAFNMPAPNKIRLVSSPQISLYFNGTN
jgi:hypothetical protein